MGMKVRLSTSPFAKFIVLRAEYVRLWYSFEHRPWSALIIWPEIRPMSSPQPKNTAQNYHNVSQAWVGSDWPGPSHPYSLLVAQAKKNFPCPSNLYTQSWIEIKQSIIKSRLNFKIVKSRTKIIRRWCCFCMTIIYIKTLPSVLLSSGSHELNCICIYAVSL